MAKPRHMPKISAERLRDPASKLVFPDLLKELAVDGLRWAEAEIALAKAEAGTLLRSYITGLAVAVLGIAIFTAAVVILAQSGVVALTPYMGSESLAGFAIGLILLAVVVLLGVLTRHFLTHKMPAMGLILQFVAGSAGQKARK
jgi:uncharacterized membrane protein